MKFEIYLGMHCYKVNENTPIYLEGMNTFMFSDILEE